MLAQQNPPTQRATAHSEDDVTVSRQDLMSPQQSHGSQRQQDGTPSAGYSANPKVS